ncbi:plasma membrane ascorbate-dependent reductase CYBRD1 isoform X2 [Lutra lutra]|uniref:plasma membrane ascorbate-dependent reductase CYBRD1 isoform X2 n=1 Tax=Lutra lutra TaxID=9657 RepID=UPI001FD61E0C|nr:plasma membrane ascorbate-dependent reductase CYBRD1 isoform X2 [Lutra lutra]
MDGYKGFLGLLVSSLLVGFLSVIFTLIWVLHYREGLGWDGTALEFNWHPVLMVTGFVFIQGIAIIVYRLPWTWKCSKLLMKSIHAGLHTVATILLLLGIFIFLLPWAPLSLRAFVMPMHVYSGLLIFGTVIAAVLMGVTEKLFFALNSSGYSKFPPEGVFTNTLGLLIVLYGALIFWIVTRPQWQRPKEPNSVLLQPNGGAQEGAGGLTVNFSNVDTPDSKLNHEASAKKRNFTADEVGQRSTM